jgi:hypothetical protein
MRCHARCRTLVTGRRGRPLGGVPTPGVLPGTACGHRCGVRCAAQLTELVEMFSPLDPNNPYADRTKFPVSSKAQPVSPAPAPTPYKSKIGEFQCESVGCGRTFSSKNGAANHFRYSCPLNTGASWTCTECQKSFVCSEPRTKRAHEQQCELARARRMAELKARPKPTDADWTKMSKEAQQLWQAGLLVKYDGSPVVPEHKSLPYDLRAKTPLGGAAITPALQQLLRGAQSNLPGDNGFSQAQGGEDMLTLRQKIHEQCVIRDGVLRDPLIGMPVTFGSHGEHPLSIENTCPGELHSWANCIVIPACLQVAHRGSIGHIGAEFLDILRHMAMLFEKSNMHVAQVVKDKLADHLRSIEDNLGKTRSANGVAEGLTSKDGAGRAEYDLQEKLYHVRATIEACVTNSIEADAKMNGWTPSEKVQFKARFYKEAVTKMTDLLIDQKALCAHQGLPIGSMRGTQTMSIQRKTNNGEGNAHFRVVYNAETNALELDIRNVEWIARVGQGNNGYDMTRKKYLYALLHSPLAVALTEQQRAAIQAEYDKQP